MTPLDKLASLELVRVRQTFDRARVDDVVATTRATLGACGVPLKPGASIAIAVGSRGIGDLATIVGEVVAWAKSQDAQPFIVPAMGSHGGATADGQEAVLAGYGITEAGVGAPVRATMDVVELPRGDCSIPVYMDALAAAADGVILINRVKPHTSFHGRFESGLMKMMTIGLGNRAQAAAVHRLGVRGLRDVMPELARQVLRSGKVLLGVAIVENAYDEPLEIQAIRAPEIPEAEPGLLELARRHMPRLPVDALDLLIVDAMGKDISGVGMDSNVIGRLRIHGEPEPERPDIRAITVHDLSPGSHGNANGMGLADVVTRRLYEKIDFAATYANVITSTFLERAKVPIVAETDREAVAIALRSAGLDDVDKARIIRIRNTLRLDELEVSPAVLASLRARPGVERLDGGGPLLDADGALRAW
jgi:hypothetical protein